MNPLFLLDIKHLRQLGLTQFGFFSKRIEVIFMKIKIAAAILTPISAIILAVALFASIAPANSLDTSLVAYGSHGEVTVQLPPAIPAHPTALRLVASDINSSSTFGARDNLIVWLWIPAYNNFIPAAMITTGNSDVLTYFKTLYNGTPIWNPPLEPNIINVSSSVLQVSKQGDIIIANLTVPQKITLPFDQMNGTQFQALGNQTFTLPALMLTFRPIGSPFNYEESTQILPHPPLSGYTVNLTSVQSPAWVQVSIPQWIGVGPFEETGHICNNLVERATPPAS